MAGHPTERYGSHPFTFWQYTGTGVIPGVTGDADINVFNGNACDLAQMAEGEHELTSGLPAPPRAGSPLR